MDRPGPRADPGRRRGRHRRLTGRRAPARGAGSRARARRARSAALRRAPRARCNTRAVRCIPYARGPDEHHHRHPAADLVSVSTAAQELGVSRASIYRWIRRGDVCAVRVGPYTLRLRAEDVDALVAPLTHDQDQPR